MEKTDHRNGKRERRWDRLNSVDCWDIIVVGGGISGAGVLREASRLGLQALLVERNDFAWGTSSRSSKMVHGGLRYLIQGDFKLTREAVIERQRLLDEAPGLVEPMKYVYPFRKGSFPGRLVFNMVLRVYDLFAGRRDYRYFGKRKLQNLFPGLRTQGLSGGTQYTDAITNDARLVMRVLQEAEKDGGLAINYTNAKALIRDGERVIGVVIEDMLTNRCCQIKAQVVVNATGAWVDQLRGELIDEKRVRPLRGSHIVIANSRLPIEQALTCHHPKDRRFFFIYPWAGMTVVGTTDLDHDENLDIEASISNEEVDYLLEGVNDQFPQHVITREDIRSTWSGVRPIVGKPGISPSQIKPSHARRNHVVWDNHGLVTVTGGKLTTFRTMALDVLSVVKNYLPKQQIKRVEAPVFSNYSEPLNEFKESPGIALRLRGAYGTAVQPMLDYAKSEKYTLIPDTSTLWAELRWALAFESVVHLDDLMLRRTHLGLLLPEGGADQMDRIHLLCEQELGWDEQCWQRELARYFDIWHNKYSVPAPVADQA